jgi:hypothetical protein
MTKVTEDANRTFAMIAEIVLGPSYQPPTPKSPATSTDAKLLIATPRASPGPDGAKIFDVLLD